MLDKAFLIFNILWLNCSIGYLLFHIMWNYFQNKKVVIFNNWAERQEGFTAKVFLLFFWPFPMVYMLWGVKK